MGKRSLVLLHHAVKCMKDPERKDFKINAMLFTSMTLIF